MDASEPKIFVARPPIFMRNKKAFAFDSPPLLNEQAIEIALTRPTD